MVDQITLRDLASCYLDPSGQLQEVKDKHPNSIVGPLEWQPIDPTDSLPPLLAFASSNQGLMYNGLQRQEA